MEHTMPIPNASKKRARLAGGQVVVSPDLRNLAGPGHLVQFYESDDCLTDSVATFLGGGLGAGDPAVVIATPDHRKKIESSLFKLGFNLQQLEENGRLVVLDASATLDTFMVDGLPDPERFRSVIGSVLRKLPISSGQPRLFGEMVAILCGDGASEAALKLERLWNDLGKQFKFLLFCGYPFSQFKSAAEAELFRHICEEHTCVIPGESFADAQTEDAQRRTLAELQQKASSLATELKKREAVAAKLEESQSELSHFVETAHIGMHWVNADGIIKWANAAEMNLLGYRPEEYIGQHISKFHADEEVISDILRRLKDDQALEEYEARLRCRDGSLKHVKITSSVLRQDGQFIHTQCLTRDVTNEVEAHQALQYLAAIVRSSDDAIISKDLNGTITSWNRAAERIFGYTEEEAIGMPVLLVIPEDRLDEERLILDRIRVGASVDHFETVRKRKDGGDVDVSVTVSPIRDKRGQIIGASNITRDITVQKQAQRELESLAQKLQQAHDELEDRVKERTSSLNQMVIQMEEFSYTVSHDLRAPLRAMSLYTRVLTEDYKQLFADEPDAARYLERIAQNCTRLDTMIRDVLTFGRVARGEIELLPVCLDRLVEDLLEQYPSLHEPASTVEVEKLGCVLGHEPSLSQVLSNILTNAVKFVRPGVKPIVRIRAKRLDGFARIEVKDNGIGIAPAYQHRLFNLFERVHTCGEYEGTGVGLAIVQRAVARMGGQVGVDSDGQNGTTFWFELPTAEGC